MNQDIITDIVLHAWDQAYESGSLALAAHLRGWLYAQMEQGRCVNIQKVLDALEDCQQDIAKSARGSNVFAGGDTPRTGQQIERPHKTHPPAPSIPQEE